jgi:D-alanyl-D-alanine dipeptidase
MNLTDLANHVPDVIIDLRYATPYNVTGQVLYRPDFHAQLDEAAAQQLERAATALHNQGLRMVVWDAYRPEDVQAKLRAINNDNRYVLEESKHCLGLAIDVTLSTNDGKYLDMGTEHDDFTPRAHVDATDLTGEQAHNRALLRETMEQVGFTQWPYEWWHFDYELR